MFENASRTKAEIACGRIWFCDKISYFVSAEDMLQIVTCMFDDTKG